MTIPLVQYQHSGTGWLIGIQSQMMVLPMHYIILKVAHGSIHIKSVSMQTCGIVIMRCIVIGNSPDVDLMGTSVDNHDVIIRTGVPVIVGNEHLVGSRTDVLITRTKKLNRTDDSFI